MAVGDIGSHKGNAIRSVCLMLAQTSNTAVPTAAGADTSDGVPTYPTNKISADDGHCFTANPALSSTLLVKATVNAGQTLAGTLTLWGYHAPSDRWYEIPLNGGTGVTPVALAETETDLISYRERILDLGHFDRLYLQLTGIGGTGASFEAWLVTSRTVSF